MYGRIDLGTGIQSSAFDPWNSRNPPDFNSEIIATANNSGYSWRWSDTDSCPASAFHRNGTCSGDVAVSDVRTHRDAHVVGAGEGLTIWDYRGSSRKSAAAEINLPNPLYMSLRR